MVGPYHLRDWWESQIKLNFGPLINLFGRLIQCYQSCAYGRFHVDRGLPLHKCTQPMVHQRSGKSTQFLNFFLLHCHQSHSKWANTSSIQLRAVHSADTTIATKKQSSKKKYSSLCKYKKQLNAFPPPPPPSNLINQRVSWIQLCN